VSEDTAHGAARAAEIATVDEERYPVPDLGSRAHLPRFTDVDERAANRQTRQVATYFAWCRSGDRICCRLLRSTWRTPTSTSAVAGPTPETSSLA
jgi:hypothetical protein